MTTLFVVCFIAGLGLSVVSYVSGMHHGHHLRLPRFVRHASVKRGPSMINAAAGTAFLTWFGGGGLLLERLSPFSLPLIYAGAAVIGFSGAALINKVINALARREWTAESLSMIGVIGRTVIPIRAGDGTGEIVFTHAGTRRVAGARSDNGRAISKGTEVIVTRYEKGIAYVVTWDELKEE
jgi:membrane protein implicated in regulation of membrane protease activity